MIKVLLMFTILFAIFMIGIKFFTHITGKQALQLTKIVGYSILCSILSIAVLVGVVILF